MNLDLLDLIRLSYSATHLSLLIYYDKDTGIHVNLLSMSQCLVFFSMV